jgi:hypothetical protein
MGEKNKLETFAREMDLDWMRRPEASFETRKGKT